MGSVEGDTLPFGVGSFDEHADQVLRFFSSQLEGRDPQVLWYPVLLSTLSQEYGLVASLWNKAFLAFHVEDTELLSPHSHQKVHHFLEQVEGLPPARLMGDITPLWTQENSKEAVMQIMRYLSEGAFGTVFQVALREEGGGEASSGQEALTDQEALTGIVAKTAPLSLNPPVPGYETEFLEALAKEDPLVEAAITCLLGYVDAPGFPLFYDNVMTVRGDELWSILFQQELHHTLSGAISEGGPTPLHLASYLYQAAFSLVAAQQLVDFVHRDLKSNNVMLFFPDPVEGGGDELEGDELGGDELGGDELLQLLVTTEDGREVGLTNFPASEGLVKIIDVGGAYASAPLSVFDRWGPEDVMVRFSGQEQARAMLREMDLQKLHQLYSEIRYLLGHPEDLEEEFPHTDQGLEGLARRSEESLLMLLETVYHDVETAAGYDEEDRVVMLGLLTDLCPFVGALWEVLNSGFRSHLEGILDLQEIKFFFLYLFPGLVKPAFNVSARDLLTHPALLDALGEHASPWNEEWGGRSMTYRLQLQ